MSKALSSPWALVKASWALSRKHAKTLISISALVGIPATFVTNYIIDPSVDSSLSAYVAFAQIALNAALIVAVIQLAKGKQIGVKQAYYQGSALLVRLVLFSFLMLLYAVPLMLGLLLLSLSVFTAGSTLSPVETAVVGLVSAAIGVPGVVLLLKGMWGAFIIGETEDGPIQALKRSHAITKGKVRRLLVRVLGLVGVILVAVVVPAGILLVLAAVTGFEIIGSLVQFAVVITVLPYATVYLHRLYTELKK